MANTTDRWNPCGPVISTRKAANERVRRDPRFMRTTRVPAAGDHGRLDSLTATAGDAFDFEDRDRQVFGSRITSPAALPAFRPIGRPFHKLDLPHQRRFQPHCRMRHSNQPYTFIFSAVRRTPQQPHLALSACATL
jgi:hypothetical protein